MDNPDSSETMSNFRERYMSYSDYDLPKIRRHGRQYEAKWFRSQYLYGGTMDRKRCIWSSLIGPVQSSWLDKSSGIMWVGVHGMDSICVVSRTGDLDIERVRHNLKKHSIESFLHNFRKTIIAEIEDIADLSVIQNRPRNAWKPFAIVSVGTDEVDKNFCHEAPYDEYEKNEFVKRITRRCEKALLRRQQCAADQQIKNIMPHHLPSPPGQHDKNNTIKFLQERMKSDKTFTINKTAQALEHDEMKAIMFLQGEIDSYLSSFNMDETIQGRIVSQSFTMEETIQAAICAFQYLLGKKFKSNEIGVTVMDPDYNVSVDEAKYNDVNAKELEIHEIERHLAVINKPCSAPHPVTEDDMD